jgi:hypothetical protein
LLRLLDELAEPLDGLLVGAEVVAVEGLLGASQQADRPSR